MDAESDDDEGDEVTCERRASGEDRVDKNNPEVDSWTHGDAWHLYIHSNTWTVRFWLVVYLSDRLLIGCGVGAGCWLVVGNVRRHKRTESVVREHYEVSGLATHFDWQSVVPL